MMMIGHFFSILLIQSVYSIDIVQVRISNDSSNSWIVHNKKEGFIVDCGCYWEHGIMLGETWNQLFPDDTLPSFIFLTHAHPDNILGLASLLKQLNVTRLPVYVSSSGALAEVNYWLEIWKHINPFEASTLLDRRQSPDQFDYKDHIKILDRPLFMFNNERIHIVSNFPTAESVHATMIYVPSARALFTGDLVGVRSHLFVSPSDVYPDSDNHVCNWIGILQGLICTFPSTTIVYPGHGDGPSTTSFGETIETNIQWLTYMRALIFNSCNTTFVMKFLTDVFRNYSNAEQAQASLANRVPHSAVSIGCKCSQNTCGGLQPPPCQFIPKNRTSSSESTALPLACIQKQLFSLSSSIKLDFVLSILISMKLIFTMI